MKYVKEKGFKGIYNMDSGKKDQQWTVYSWS